MPQAFEQLLINIKHHQERIAANLEILARSGTLPQSAVVPNQGIDQHFYDSLKEEIDARQQLITLISAEITSRQMD